MTDRRFFPANDRVVLDEFAARAPGRQPVAGTPASVVSTVADLCNGPQGPRDRQLLFGDQFLCLETRDGWTYGQARKDGYVGYLSAQALGPASEATHFVAVRSTHAYATGDVRAPDVRPLSFGSELRVVAEEARYFEIADGTFVPKPHLRPLAQRFRDMVTVAQVFFGTPYLWGGNSAWGIDCSGLVQLACTAAGVPCPPDSDLQADELGEPVDRDDGTRRGDLFFWKGHVAIAVDDTTLVHANGHHMAVAYEPIDTAIARIAAQEGLEVTGRRRIG